ncbi:MAG TPA: hypothetical protein VJ917_01610 [Saprospiraceae bacterium]|nr:hypothetical protein [Saprospiraceae bacterium]
MKGLITVIATFLFFLGPQFRLEGQDSFLPTEEQLIETQWSYAYATHPESGDILHRGGEGFEYYVYFKYDQSYIALLNRDRYVGKWAINGIRFQFSFNGVSNFKIHQLTEERLVLLYESEYTGQQMLYHFTAVSPMDSPMNEMENLLPKVTVNQHDEKGSKQDKNWFVSWLDRLFDRYTPEPEPYVRIELTGGGFYGGLNHVLKDYITIGNDGTIIKEMMTEEYGNHKLIAQMEREELLRFAAFVSEKGFFEMPRIVDCQSNLCSQRKYEKPIPIPLRLSITYGERKNIITVPIWGKETRRGQWIEVPVELEAIVFAIQNMAHSRL